MLKFLDMLKAWLWMQEKKKKDSIITISNDCALILVPWIALDIKK